MGYDLVRDTCGAREGLLTKREWNPVKADRTRQRITNKKEQGKR